MANDRLGQSSRAKMTALILAEQRPKALHKILWIGISTELQKCSIVIKFQRLLRLKLEPSE